MDKVKKNESLEEKLVRLCEERDKLWQTIPAENCKYYYQCRHTKEDRFYCPNKQKCDKVLEQIYELEDRIKAIEWEIDDWD